MSVEGAVPAQSAQAYACSPEEARAFRTPLPVLETLFLKSNGAYPICPRCHASMDREFISFCDRCGQALDWSLYGDSIIILRP